MLIWLRYWPTNPKTPVCPRGAVPEMAPRRTGVFSFRKAISQWVLRIVKSFYAHSVLIMFIKDEEAFSLNDLGLKLRYGEVSDSRCQSRMDLDCLCIGQCLFSILLAFHSRACIIGSLPCVLDKGEALLAKKYRAVSSEKSLGDNKIYRQCQHAIICFS